MTICAIHDKDKTMTAQVKTMVLCRLAVVATKHAVLAAPIQGGGGGGTPAWTHREFLPQAWHVSTCSMLLLADLDMHCHRFWPLVCLVYTQVVPDFWIVCIAIRRPLTTNSL